MLVAAVAAGPVVSAVSQARLVTPAASPGDLLTPDLRRRGRDISLSFAYLEGETASRGDLAHGVTTERQFWLLAAGA